MYIFFVYITQHYIVNIYDISIINKPKLNSAEPFRTVPHYSARGKGGCQEPFRTVPEPFLIVPSEGPSRTIRNRSGTVPNRSRGAYMCLSRTVLNRSEPFRTIVT
jgi:hypothetical protein